MMFRGNNRARQGATVGGAPTGQTVTTGDSVVGGRCDYSAPTDDPQGYYRLCLDAKNGTIKMDGTKSPIRNTIKIEINGQVYELPASAAIVGSDAAVTNNAVLKTATGDTGKRLLRLGFTAPGDGGLATYNWSDTNCATADDGAQVQPTGITGCWIADFNGTQPTPMIWGAKGDGTTDDTVPVQAAIDALPGKTLYIGPFKYCIGSPGLVTYRPISIQGQQRSDMTNSAMSDKYGFTACALNINMLTLGNNGTTSSSGGVIENVLFDAGTAGTNTSGAAIVNDGTYGNEVKNVRINRTCIGIDERKSHMGRVSGVAIRSEFQDLSGGGNCGGIRVGANSTSAGTVDYHISDTHIDTVGNWSLLVMDAGGLLITSSDFLLSEVYGVWIAPGTSQAVMWLTASHTYLSDQACGTGLLIEPSFGGVVAGLHFTQTWTATSGRIPLNPACTSTAGVVIKNSGAGFVNGVHFVGHRSYANGGPGFYVGADTHNVTIDNSVICGNGKSSPGNYAGIELQAGVVEVAMRNNRIGGHCSDTLGTFPDVQGYGINVAGTSSYLTITGNDLRGNMTAGLSGTVSDSDNVIANNLGVDEKVTDVPATASITLGFEPTAVLTGASATITNVLGMWAGRRAIAYARDAAQTFAAGGNMCHGPVTLPAGQVAVLQQVPGANCIAVK